MRFSASFSASVSTNYPTVLRTRRLILRQWQESDFLPYAKLNADQRVMEFMLGTMTEEETRQRIENIGKHFDAHGFGRWAVQIADSEKFIGFVGISIPTYTLPFSPCVEVAWRICSGRMGKGICTRSRQRSDARRLRTGRATRDRLFHNIDQLEVPACDGETRYAILSG